MGIRTKTILGKLTADVKAFDNEYPTVSNTNQTNHLTLIHPLLALLTSYDQDHPPLTFTDTQEDSASATCGSAAPHNQVFTEHSVK